MVAIDANLTAIEQAKIRFSEESQEGRFAVVECGCLGGERLATFWVSDLPEWSSFDERIASPERNTPSGRTSSNDRLCVEALAEETLPTFISAQDDFIAMPKLLRNVGYFRFKFVRQGSWTPVRTNSAAHFGVRLLTSFERGSRVRGAIIYSGRMDDLRSSEGYNTP